MTDPLTDPFVAHWKMTAPAKQEMPGRDRYKLFQPSNILKQLFDRSLNVDLVSVLRAVNIDSAILEIGGFVYVVAFVGSRFVAVAVRGTTSWSDWLFINANFLLNRGMVGGYHKGWHNEACTAKPKLLRLFSDRNIAPRVPIYFTGHSLGAAVAGILAKICPTHVMKPYLFASPRFATDAHAQLRPPYAYVTPEDLVPHLPPESFGFADAGAPLHVMPPSQKQLPGVQSFKHCLSLSDLMAPHKIERYRRLLGLEIHEDFGETVYMDRLLKEIKDAG